MNALRRYGYVLLVLLLASSSWLTALGGSLSLETRVELLIKTVEAAKVRVDALITLAIQLNVTIPEDVLNDYQMAVNRLEEAKGLLGEENPDYELIIQYLLEALTLFRECYREIYALIYDEQEFQWRTGALMEAIERAWMRINRIKEILDSVDLEGEDEVYSLLNEAEAKLIQAEEELNDGNLSEAAKLLGEANKLIGRATAKLRGLGELLCKKRIKEMVKEMRGKRENVTEAAVNMGVYNIYKDRLDEIGGLLDSIEETEDIGLALSLMRDAEDKLNSVCMEIHVNRTHGMKHSVNYISVYNRVMSLYRKVESLLKARGLYDEYADEMAEVDALIQMADESSDESQATSLLLEAEAQLQSIFEQLKEGGGHRNSHHP